MSWFQTYVVKNLLPKLRAEYFLTHCQTLCKHCKHYFCLVVNLRSYRSSKSPTLLAQLSNPHVLRAHINQKRTWNLKIAYNYVFFSHPIAFQLFHHMPPRKCLGSALATVFLQSTPLSGESSRLVIFGCHKHSISISNGVIIEINLWLALFRRHRVRQVSKTRGNITEWNMQQE